MTADPPPATERLTFAEMTVDDLDDMAAMLGDPLVMRYYPRPKTRSEALDWIRWNEGLYRGHGFGLWVLRSRATGEFVGDCGLTPQPVDGVTEVEVGYHLRTGMQGRGLATEAATTRATGWPSTASSRSSTPTTRPHSGSRSGSG